MSDLKDFELLETLRYEAGSGFYLLERHLARLTETARFFGIPCDASAAHTALEQAVARLKGRYRIRVLVSCAGETRVECHPLDEGALQSPVRVSVCEKPVSSSDPFLHHKTTRRTAYEDRLALRPDCVEVILVNERGEVTECCTGNLVARVRGRKVTPPTDAGLLPGTFRAALLAAGEIEEDTLRIVDIERAEALFLINSVRGWVRLKLVD